MKKLLCLTVLLTLLVSGKAYSQFVGIKGGGNVAMFNNSSSTDAALYFHTGIYLRDCLESYNYRWSPMHNRFFFQPELTYSRQGATANVYDEDIWFKNDYVNLSLIFQYRPIRRLGIEFGPQAGYMVISDITDKWVGKKYKEDSKDLFKRVDYTLCFGLLYTTEFFCDFSFRYNLGLNNILKHNDGKSIRNGVLQFSMLIDLW